MKETLAFTSNPYIGRLNFMTDDISAEVIGSAYPTGNEPMRAIPLSRRRFLKGALAATAAIALQKPLSQLDAALGSTNEKSSKDEHKDIQPFTSALSKLVVPDHPSVFWEDFLETLHSEDRYSKLNIQDFIDSGYIKAKDLGYYPQGLADGEVGLKFLIVEPSLDQKSTAAEVTFNIDNYYMQGRSPAAAFDNIPAQSRRLSEIDQFSVPSFRGVPWNSYEGGYLQRSFIDPETKITHVQTLDQNEGQFTSGILYPETDNTRHFILDGLNISSKSKKV